ncbi:glycosyltransferase family 4 protein [Elstera cyanobacteriorum]|uniref:Colanic acid biosynthesis glycosyltransferase WcaL n=1 Tax=Elstera cyanobacteriorum TaxID=2022747 RepID=A0A255XI15_9PROT|nr:glycosyltransferase family 4 protein [Elstera cyanobacteriorum]OYQ16607.1 colanic acid biosynthesis glycosyltransferase WcaL [Elstera cyanobacteriorum]
MSSSILTVVLKGYPRLSETFIAQELLGLEQRGFRLHLVSLRRPTDKKRHPIHDQIAAPVTYLPEYLYQEPGRVLRAWWKVRRLPGYRRAFWQWLKDWRRDPTPNRGRRWGQALVLAAELPPDRALIYSHFMHTPGSVARYAALMRGIPFALSAHAKDIWTIPAWEKREKLADAAWAVTCTGANADHLRGLAADPGRVDLVYHGLDLSRFPPPPARKAGHDGRDAAQPVRLLSVGRLVAKKGYDDLLHALAGLPEGLHWRLIHIGGGDKTDLLRLAADLGIADKIDWRGAQAQTEVLAAYREADLFVLASRIAADGDRDGLPNVLMEAQSQGLACAATAVSAIPELIRDGETGLLVPPEDPPALAAALARLIADPGLRTRLGGAGQARVRADFGTAPGLDQLVRRLAPFCPPSP